MALSSGYDYEVFLSFRGPDTREGFTDFLYTRLKDVGIRTFKDDEELRVGEEFAPELLQAIKQSKISIPIFSKGYASSAWCLRELVQMVACQKAGRQKIMPIFYDVSPLEVRHQNEAYKEAFSSHKNKKRHDEKTIQEWKDALNAVAEINGWNLQSRSNRQQGEFTREVTHGVLRELKKPYLAISKALVSVDNHIDAIMEMIGAGTSETRIIGIHGMGGIGKTTIAKQIYNKLSDDFEHCCFLRDVRETSKNKGIHCLQNDLISDILKTNFIDIKDIDEGTQTIEDRLSNKRVLLLLDDVEEENHIDALLGKPNWLGQGSKIIITTRNKEVLKPTKVVNSYEVNGMDPDQSLQLFSKHAFRRDSPLDEYIDQSNRAIGIAKGLPLALVVIGSLLSSYIKKEEWDEKLNKLAKIPHVDVRKKLKISYDALEVQEQQIFLDIACLFIGYEKDIVVHFWERSKSSTEESMEILQNRSLIKIDEYNNLWMHDQLRDLGRAMVCQESNLQIKKQSRVWDHEEALELLRRYEGKKEVEALCFKIDREGQFRFTYEGFKSLPDLRFLQVDSLAKYFDAEERLFWHESPLNALPIEVFQENSDLLPELRWFAWHDIPPTFNIMNFSMRNVVILDLSRSRITHDWEGWSHMKVMKNLKVLDLRYSFSLKTTPDFSALSNLERLILHGCYILDEIDESIRQLKSLVLLDVSRCGNLQRLPNTIGDLGSLIELDILDTGIKELPDSIRKLKLLNKLNISKMRIQKLPHSIGNLESLIELDISTTGIKELPDSIGKLKKLKVMKMNWSAISKIPNALWTIEKLEVIEAIIPSCHFDVEIGNHICRNRFLRILKLSRGRIYKVPRLPESLTILELSDLYMNTFPDLSNLTNLKELELWFVPRNYIGESKGESDGPMEEDPMPLRIGSSDGESDGPMEKDLTQWIGNLSKLESLVLDSPYVTALPIDIRSLLPQLKSLKLRCPNLCCLPSLPSSLLELNLESKCVTTLPMDMSSLLPRLKTLELNCPNLHCLPSLPSSLSSLDLRDCKSCCSMEDLSNLKTLSDLSIVDCAISEIRGLDHLENLKESWLGKLQQVKILPDLRNLNELWHLQVFDCDNLVEIQGELPSSLQKLEIMECGSLLKLPDLSSSKGLERVKINDCGKLNVEEISSLCLEKSIIFVEDDNSDIEFIFDV